MSQYQQLTEDDRIEIYAMKQAGKSQAYIAKQLTVHPSTISRELARNTGLRGYRPRQAHRLATKRRHCSAKAVKMTPETIAYIEQKIRVEHSPEQIAGRMKVDPSYQGPCVSHERIYQHLWQDKAQGGTLYQFLRIAGHKKKRKRYGKHDFRGIIPDRIGIEQRPKIVDAKKRFGDWEADTLIGKHHKGAIVSLVERKSQFALLGQVHHKTAEAVKTVIIKQLSPYRKRVHTITTDNGREFASHGSIASKLKADVYFAQPYQSWQRGLNEQVNGLVRQYLPKKTDLRHTTEQELGHIMNRLNHRPRKLLGFKTPYEVFCNQSKFTNLRVALGS